MMAALKRFFNKRPDEFDEAPKGVCPNCWGDQEYGNVIRKKYKDIRLATVGCQNEQKHFTCSIIFMFVAFDEFDLCRSHRCLMFLAMGL